MWKNYKRSTVDPFNPYLPIYYGTFRETVTVNGVTRNYISYIPEETKASTAGIFILPGDGISAEEMFQNSNWKEIADTEECKEKMILIFLEPLEGKTWNTKENYGCSDGEITYVDAVFQDASRRNRFCIHESKNYVIGYQEGAVIAQKAVMWNPAVFAGLACLGGNQIENSYKQAAGKSYCTNLHGYIDDSARKKILKSDIPVPVWLIEEEYMCSNADSSNLTYWCDACQTELHPQKIDPDVNCYFRLTDPEYPINQEKAAYRVWHSVIPNASDRYGYRFNRRIWKDFLYGVRRWMADPGGDLRITKDPVRDLKMEYHFEEVGGWIREWYTYIPPQVKNDPQKKVPLVFAMHGYTCSGEIYIGNSDWHKVAEKYGFIVIFPSAVADLIDGMQDNQGCKKENILLPAWNNFAKDTKPDEIAFFKHMFQDTRENYAIDISRVFATGHSWGSMVTQLLGMALPDIFTAIAPCSGILFDEQGEKLLLNPAIIESPQTEVPVWMFVGECEEWLIPCIPKDENSVVKSIHIWWDRNKIQGEKPNDFTSGWTKQKERWNDLYYYKNEIPMIRYTWIEYLPHATMTEMSFRIWEEFFSNLRRDKTGMIHWDPQS